MSCSFDPGIDSCGVLCISLIIFLAFWDYDCFQKIHQWHILQNHLEELACERFEPATFLFGDGVLSKPYCQSHLIDTYYSLVIKRTSSVHLTTVHANLIEQTTSSIELVVLKRRIIVVIRKDSRCLLLHRLEQHQRILLSKETYRTLAHPADPCGNPFGDMI